MKSEKLIYDVAWRDFALYAVAIATTFLFIFGMGLVFSQRPAKVCLTVEEFTENVDKICRSGLYDVINKTVIPKRLHQIFSSAEVPTVYHESIRSWLTNHPDWEYYFWTDTDAQRMIQDRYPQYSTLLSNVTLPLLRSDVIRYFILHQYGGIYADMDVQSLRPIEPFLKSNSCILVDEPKLQTQLVYNISSTLTNTIMACVAQHPFLDMVIRKLNSTLGNNTNELEINMKNSIDLMNVTGSFFLNRTLNEYRKLYGQCRKDAYCSVYQSEFKYLVPTYDLEALKTVSAKCHGSLAEERLGYYEIKACGELILGEFNNSIPEESYTNHLWLHLEWFRSLETKQIPEIVPRVFRYDQMRYSEV